MQTTLTQSQIDRHAERLASSKKYAAQKFGISEDDIIDYNSGCCYNKIWVKTSEAAKKVSKSVKNGTVNGGMFHEMPLGGISISTNNVYEVIC